MLGRRLTERLLRAGWIEPVRANGGIYYDRRAVHSAMKRMQREGFLIDGHARRRFAFEAAKVPKRTKAETEIFDNLDLSELL